MNPIARRTLLQGLGAVAAGGVLGGFRPGVLPYGEARATPSGKARRIVFYVSGHGTVHDRWEMPGGAGLDTAIDRPLGGLAEEAFSHILAPLHPFRDKLLVLDGLANYGGLVAAFNEHEEGNASCMTGAVPIPVAGSLGVSPGPSIDQVIAATRSTPIRSLEYGIGGWSVNFDDAGQPIPYEGDLWSAYDRLFPSGNDPGGPPTVADKVKLHRSTVLGLAQARFDRLAPKLSAEDRLKIEQHRDLLSDLDAQLAGLAELECDVPPAPGAMPSWYDVAWAEETTRAFMELAKAALVCGITDVITIRQDVLRNEAIGAPPGDLHTDFAHNVVIDPAAADVMSEYHRWHAERFAELCAMLDAIPEEDGTMLDQTLCVWTNELGTGDHQMSRIPLVIAGGTGALQSGRYVNFAPERDFQGPWGTYEATGPAHNRLLVVLAQAMGLEVDAIGETTFTDHNGASLDATGALPGLLA